MDPYVLPREISIGRELQTFQKDVKGKGKAVEVTPADEVYYRMYRSEEEDLSAMMQLVDQELSEPYNCYTFRYFLIEWPHLAFLAYANATDTVPIATILCKQDVHKGKTNRGYIAMLSVDKRYRRRGIGMSGEVAHFEADCRAKRLVQLTIDQMFRHGAQEVVLETEFDNLPSLTLYGCLGFIREKRLHRFYSNGKDAFRLILPLPDDRPDETLEEAEEARDAIACGPDDMQERYGIPPPIPPRPKEMDYLI